MKWPRTLVGIVLGILGTAGQVFAYRIGIRPTIDYQPVARPRLTRNQVLSAINRTIGYLVAGYLSATVDAPELVEHAIFGEDPVDGRAPTRRVVFTEDVLKIAG